MEIYRKTGLRKVFLILFIMFSFTVTLRGQIIDVNVGDLQFTWDELGYLDGDPSRGNEPERACWPQGWYERTSMVHFFIAGAFSEGLVGYSNGVDASEGLDTVEYGVQIYQDPTLKAIRPSEEIRKYRPPEKVVDGVPERPFRGEVNSDLPSPVVAKSLASHSWYGLNNWGCMGGPWYKVKVYAFDNQEYNDFVIFDVWMINALDWDTDDTLADGPPQDLHFWFGFDMLLAPTLAGRREYGDVNNDHPHTCYKWTEWVASASDLVAPGTTERDSLVISYACDANSPAYAVWDDFGDPSLENGELLSPQYIGFTTLHADISSTDRTDDAAQPVSCCFMDLEQNIWTNSYEEWGDGYGAALDWMSMRNRDTSDTGPNPWTPIEGIEAKQFSREARQMNGPYDMAYQDSVHWVFALGVGSIDPEYALELGRNWYTGSVSDLEKDSTIATGLDSLINTLDKAKWAWENFEESGDFGIPKPPPAPNLEVISGPSCIYLNWDYENIEYSGSISEWRVYRKEGNYQVHHPDDNGFKDYELIQTTTDNSFTDNSAVRGVAYHYFVTAVDDSGLESNNYQNRTLYAASPFEPGKETTDDVIIVPNPYRVDAGGLNYSDPNRITFFNLPPYCTLKIYNEVGDLIKTIEHTDGSGDESWDQINTSNQFVKSGVYILSVQDARDIEENSLPTSNHKFVIIR